MFFFVIIYSGYLNNLCSNTFLITFYIGSEGDPYSKRTTRYSTELVIPLVEDKNVVSFVCTAGPLYETVTFNISVDGESRDKHLQ